MRRDYRTSPEKRQPRLRPAAEAAVGRSSSGRAWRTGLQDLIVNRSEGGPRGLKRSQRHAGEPIMAVGTLVMHAEGNCGWCRW